MDVNEDFVDIARGFIDNGVEFLVVGAYALAEPERFRSRSRSRR
jgi:hypothetical protein